MINRVLHCMGILLLMSLVASANADEVKYDRYVNVRFAFGISYPVGILVPQGEADNGDGQRFLSKDGKTSMLAYGYNNAADDTLNSIFHDEIAGKKKSNQRRAVTYKVLKKTWFVVSGTEEDMLFYTKVVYLKDKDQFINIRIAYPKSQRRFYDPIVSVVSNSMKALP
jgi:hypothetical protein